METLGTMECSHSFTSLGDGILLSGDSKSG